MAVLSRVVKNLCVNHTFPCFHLSDSNVVGLHNQTNPHTKYYLNVSKNQIQYTYKKHSRRNLVAYRLRRMTHNDNIRGWIQRDPSVLF